MAVTADGKEIIPGCEPWSAPGGPHGALVLHGYTGSPQSVRGLAEALHDAGFAVEMPLLPGHGTSVDDLVDTTWDDWSAAAEAAHQSLAARVDEIVVAGLSMGGALTFWLAARHPGIAGIVCINPVVDLDAELVGGIRQLLDGGADRMPGIGSDVADPAARESAYDATPLRPLLSAVDAAAAGLDDLAKVACPLLLMTSPQDHVVDPRNSDVAAARVAGPVERVTLERSYHVATLDYDKDLVFQRSVEFARRVTGSPAGG